MFFFSFFFFILFSSCVNKSYCICSLKFGICHICIQKTASLSFKNYDPPCHYNKGQVTLMCQQLSDYVVGSYTKCVNKRRYIYRGHLEKYLHPLITFNAVAILSRWQKLRFTVECLCIQRRKITWGYCKTMRSEWKKERSVLILSVYNLLWSCRTKSLSEVFS